MAQFISGGSAPVARVNVVPIIDVALVLVIILMITAPMIAVSDVDVQLPEARARSLEGDDRVSITLGPAGELAVDDVDVTAATMPGVLAARISDHGDGVVVVVRADETAAYASVEALVKQARAAGAKRIAVGTRQRGGSDE